MNVLCIRYNDLYLNEAEYDKVVDDMAMDVIYDAIAGQVEVVEETVVQEEGQIGNNKDISLRR